MDIFLSEVQNIGEYAFDFLSEKMVILFRDDAPLDLAKFSVLIKSTGLILPIEVGDEILIGDNSYNITALGQEVNTNLRDLCHVVLKFDGSYTAMLPGNIHIAAEEIPDFYLGKRIIFRKRGL